MKNKQKLVLFLAISALIVIGLQAWDDEKLFTTIQGGKGKSNVVLVQDRTGSMCSIIYHPDFNVKDSTLDSYSNVDISLYPYQGITQTSWYLRWWKDTYISNSTGRFPIYAWNSTTNVLSMITGSTNTRIKANDWILQYRDLDGTRGDDQIEFNINYQMVAKVTEKSTGTVSGVTYTYLTLDPATIKGTPMAGASYYIGYYSDSTYTPRIVKLYGTSIDQEASANYRTSYAMDRPNGENRYLQWIFGKANDAQRQQITDFSTLAYDVEYNAYLRATPVRPDLAFALNEDYPAVFNSNSSETLLEEWNSVMQDLYPNKIANLQNDPINATATTIHYYGAMDSFKDYQTEPFFIKIDAETMRVDTHTPNITDPLKAGEGELIVVRGQKNTTAATHPFGSAIMIYNDEGLGIDESTPEIHLFSSMQHVDEPTGDVDPTWTETRNIDGTDKTCWRYKRVFTRIQVAREALCDVVTAKNKLLKIADLTPEINDTVTVLNYCNANADFLTRVAPFYIKISDAANPDNDEIMRVTAHDPVTYTLTVTRGQQGTDACPHVNYAAIKTYSGARDLVRFGIFTFSADDNPVSKRVDLNDFGQKNTDGTYKAASSVNTVILDQVNGIRASGGTPLGRALAYIWNYLKPNTVTGSAPANYISSNWKAVDATTFGAAEKFETIDGVTHPKGSPMEYWCQENYAVMITDGDATSDSVSDLGVFGQTSQKTTLASGIISDFFKFDYNHTYYGPSRWGDAVNDGSEYLTDVAFFLYHQDMFPTKRIKTSTWDSTNYIYASGTPEADANLYDETNTDPRKQWPGNQNIKTYTVGLCLANTVLPKAAKNGGGASFTASNYRDLTEAFLNIITSVVLAQEPMSYTTYAAPKQSITEGKYGYIAHFIPRERAMWEGHLRRYRLSYTGAFPTAIDSTTERVPTDEFGGSEVSFQWDAGVILNSRTTERVVYTSIPSGSVWSPTPINFMSLGFSDLGVATDAQATQVKKFIQNFNKSDGINANSDYNNLYRLGETFHFNPQLVGYPLAWKAAFDPSYKSFYDYYSTGSNKRTEVVYTGANDGKLHCFQSSDAGGIAGGTELWSYVPFALLKQLKEPALNPLITASHTYFVDGKSLVKDIKVGNSGTYSDWKTGLFFGLGIGGRAYCALDITNPTALKVLWETQDSAETVANGHMGYTEAKPVQVNMYGGSTLLNFPGMILAGGYNAAEVQATDVITAQDWQRREGKALYILNANTGALIKKFVYGASASESASLDQIPTFLTAMTAAPAVLDSNNDGFADVIYFAESGDYKLGNFPSPHGGAIWKINCYGDPSTWHAQKIYQAPDGQTIFISPSLAYDTDYRVWVMFGTGRRPRPAEGLGTGFTNLTGQFVAFIDDGSSTAITNANLHSADTAVASAITTEYTIDDSGLVKKGFYFNFFLTNEIMFEPQPLYVNQMVYFMTFTPREGTGSSGATDDPCGGDSAVNGSHYIYQFKLTSQGNTFVIGDFLNQSGKILGYGPIDDKFTIYVGAGDAGNFKSDEANRITDELKNSNSALLWKEDKK